MTQWATKSVETLGSKIQFLSVLDTFPPFPSNNFHFSTSSNARSQHLHSIALGARGLGKLTLHANKIQQMLKYRKASFPKSVSTTFVAHCSLQTQSNNDNGIIPR